MDGTRFQNDSSLPAHDVAPRIRLPMNHAGFGTDDDVEHVPSCLRTTGYELPALARDGRRTRAHR
jgi:hypothetical protein